MPAPSRREKIEGLLRLEPEDQFLRYGLANELEAEGQNDQAWTQYQTLMNDPEPHVPSFLRSAQLLVRLDRVTEARTVLRAGIEAARQQGNSHAAGEMAELLASLGVLGE